MLCGKAYARAIRCRSLIRLALALIILKDINFSKNKEVILDDFCLRDNRNLTDLKDDKPNFLQQKFNKKLEELKQNGPTAKLFIQYFEMVSVLLQFIHAENLVIGNCI